MTERDHPLPERQSFRPAIREHLAAVAIRQAIEVARLRRLRESGHFTALAPTDQGARP